MGLVSQWIVLLISNLRYCRAGRQRAESLLVREAATRPPGSPLHSVPFVIDELQLVVLPNRPSSGVKAVRRRFCYDSGKYAI